jgi:tRNA A58 N-methylase Trm61
MGDTIYVLGHSQAEIRRLIKQASIVQATTERLLRSAGIERGMRVLDLGCGAGDVSMLAATLVGVSGSVAIELLAYAAHCAPSTTGQGWAIERNPSVSSLA